MSRTRRIEATLSALGLKVWTLPLRAALARSWRSVPWHGTHRVRRMSDHDPPDERHRVFAEGVALIGRSWRLEPIGHAVATTSAILYALASVAFTIVLGRVTDDVIVPGFADGGIPRSTLLVGLGLVLLVGSSRALGAMGRRWFLSWAEYATQRTWRRDLTDRYLDVPMEYHHRTPAGQLLAHADADIEAATRVLKPVAFAIGTVALGFFAFVSLVLVSWWLALVALVLFPLLSLMNRVYTQRVAALSMRERQQTGEVSAIAHESFDGALMVKTLGREEAEVERLNVAATGLRDTRIGIGAVRAVFEPLIDALPTLGVIALLAIGSWLVGDGKITTGELVTSMALFSILSVPIRVVGFFLQEMPMSVAALKRVDKVHEEPLEPQPEMVVALPDGALGLEFDAVSFSYASDPANDAAVPVLSGLSFSVAPGEVVAIVGSTGSGKSTIGSLIAKLIDPSAGRILVGGVDLRSLSEAERTATTTLVFQEAFLFGSSIRENLVLGAAADHETVTAALRTARADEFIAETAAGLDTMVGERGITLSGGQRQRIALARALLRNPRVLVLDDATSAVDPTIEAEILSGLDHELQATVVVIAYRLATIALADRVLYVADGRLAAEGTHSELMANDDYAALIRAYAV